MAFQGPFEQPQKSDIYEQLIEELGTVIVWQFKLDQWQQADFDESGLADPEFQDQPANLNDIYWSSGIKYVHDGDTWINQNSVTPPDQPPTQYPISPEFPDNPEDGDIWTDPITGDVWYWWDDRWQTKPEPGEGGITEVYTYDVITDESEKAALTDVLRVIPDLDLTQLNNQKDVNWAISNAIDALDTQVDQNSGRLDDLTLLVPGSRYLYEPASVYPRPPQTGKFYLGNGFTFTEVFGDVTQIMIHHTDHTGTEHTLENVTQGDSIIIEHDLDAQNFGRYQVTEVFHNFADSIITVEVVSHRGSAEADQTYDVLAFPDVNVSDKPSYDYVDQGLDTKVNRKGGDSMEGPLKINAQDPTDHSAKAIQIVDGTNTLLSINGQGKMSWHHDADASFMKSDQEHFSLTTLSNGLAQTVFNSWMYLPDSGIQLGTDRNTQLTGNQLYMNGSSKNLELTGGAYIQTGRIRPAPDKFGDGISLEGKVNIGGFANGDFGMVVEDDQVAVNAPIIMNSNQITGRAGGLKITGLATPTSNLDAANKKYVDDTVATQSDIYVEKSGDVMTGTLIAPRLESKTASGEATMLVEGWVNGTASAAKITMSNKQYINAYGTIQFKGSNASGWFQFNKDIDLGTKGLHSVTRLRLVGDKAIQDGTTNRILLNNKVTIPKAGDSNVKGFVVKGKTNEGNNGSLLHVYHNASGYDAVNYEGKQSPGSNNVATTKYVDDKVNVATQTLGVKTWPGRRFTFKGYGLIGSALDMGTWSPGINGLSTNIAISVEDLDGMRIIQGSPDYVPGVSSLTLTVYQLTDNTWTAKGFGVYGGTQTDFRSDYIKLTGFEWKQKPTLTNNTTYALHVGSMW